jgi:DNA adenine methylase
MSERYSKEENGFFETACNAAVREKSKIRYPVPSASNRFIKQGRNSIISRMGGKTYILDWLLSSFPKKGQYGLFVDVFCGSASVALSNKGRHITIINDLDSELMNLYSVLRDEQKSHKLAEQIYFTMYSRDEFNGAFIENTEDSDIEKARKFLIKSRQSVYAKCNNWMACKSQPEDRTDSKIAAKFSYLSSEIIDFTDKIKKFQIENKPFSFILDKYDTEETFFYCDPPYIKSAQISKTDYYDHIMTETDHIELIELCKTRKGMVAISGLKTDLYIDLLKDWKLITHEHTIQSSGGLVKGKINEKTMIDCLWVNYETMNKQNDLFNI